MWCVLSKEWSVSFIILLFILFATIRQTIQGAGPESKLTGGTGDGKHVEQSLSWRRLVLSGPQLGAPSFSMVGHPASDCFLVVAGWWTVQVGQSWATLTLGSGWTSKPPQWVRHWMGMLGLVLRCKGVSCAPLYMSSDEDRHTEWAAPPGS